MKTKFLSQKKKGAASIYVIVVTALLFSIITAGFISLVVNELEKSTENSLAQSAYDSALAGVEDAKVALSKYYQCLEEGAVLGEPDGNPNETTCSEILWYINESMNLESDYCDVVSDILVRNEADGDTTTGEEVLIKETSEGGTETAQAYTCVKLNTQPTDYRASLTTDNPIHVIPLKAENSNNIKKVRISWWNRGIDGDDRSYTNKDYFNSLTSTSIDNETSLATPPTIAVQLYQYSYGAGDEGFYLNDFNDNDSSDIANGVTNRGTLWLVPTDEKNKSTAGYNLAGKNALSGSPFVKSNSHDVSQKDSRKEHQKNEPYYIYCDGDDEGKNSEYLCSVEIEIPSPKGGTRSEPPLLVISLPYGKPKSDFKVEMLTEEDQTMQFDNVQIVVDSTGRTNDVFRRVEARVEFSDINFPYPEYALDLGSEGGTALSKNFRVTKNCWTSKNGEIKECEDRDEESYSKNDDE